MNINNQDQDIVAQLKTTIENSQLEYMLQHDRKHPAKFEDLGIAETIPPTLLDTLELDANLPHTLFKDCLENLDMRYHGIPNRSETLIKEADEKSEPMITYPLFAAVNNTTLPCYDENQNDINKIEKGAIKKMIDAGPEEIPIVLFQKSDGIPVFLQKFNGHVLTEIWPKSIRPEQDEIDQALNCQILIEKKKEAYKRLISTANQPDINKIVIPISEN